MDPIEIAAAVQVAAQVLALVQSALAAGQTHIDPADFAASVTLRDSNLAKLDADIAARQVQTKG